MPQLSVIGMDGKKKTMGVIGNNTGSLSIVEAIVNKALPPENHLERPFCRHHDSCAECPAFRENGSC